MFYLKQYLTNIYVFIFIYLFIDKYSDLKKKTFAFLKKIALKM